VQLQADRKKIEDAGVTLVAVSYDATDVLASFAKDKAITFPLLSDAGSKTIDAYGIRDPSGNGYPHPATFLIDKEGVVRTRLSVEGYMTRHSTDELIEASKRLK
jgi:peroxiredoxin